MDKDWYKDAVVYQVHIKSFKDSNGDGIGDIKGLTSKLDYLESLGINALWVLPFYPSPLRDDGYDIQEYTSVNSDYGNIRDFKVFLKEAHQRGIRVITELVLNHTSDQHPWFQRARRSPKGSNYRNYYVWNDSPDKYQEARIIFKDFESSNWSWDPLAKSYYWHRFYSHQPDLNFENTNVQMALFKVIDFWFKLGVDGMRLDAVPYLYEEEGTNCENLPKTYEYLKKLRKYIDSRYKDKMLLAEANQWPEDAVEYFGRGDACHMAFHFPLMPRMFMSLKMEDRFPIIDILEQTPEIPKNCQWALFLRNHDELTLEMVTDEERDYMYSVYAKDEHSRINMGIRRRLAPLLENNRRKIELLNFLLFCLPGTPIIYYGDEIGMGDNYYLGDRDGVRTPMQWNENKNAGFSDANPQRLFLPVVIDPEYNYETINIETQEKNSSSLLWWMRRIINLRKQYQAFGRGEIEFLQPDNQSVVAFIRTYKEESLLVITNLSRYTQPVELNLSEYEGYRLIEVFSNNSFPSIKHYPYLFTLSAYDYNCFLLKKPLETPEETVTKVPLIKITASDLKKPAKSKFIRFLEKVLPEYLFKQRWFASKGSSVQKTSISDLFSYDCEGYKAFTLFVQVDYSGKNFEVYQLPLIIIPADDILFSKVKNNIQIAAELRLDDNKSYYLVDALESEEFRLWLYKSLKGKKRISSSKGTAIRFLPDKNFPVIAENIVSRNISGDQSNSVVVYNDELFIKLYRRIEAGEQPELEILKYLRENDYKVNTPGYMGHFIYKSSQGKDLFNLAICENFIESEADGWNYTLDIVKSYLEKVMVAVDKADIKYNDTNLYCDSLDNFDKSFNDYLNPLFIEVIGKLARSLAYLHIALGSGEKNSSFAEESYSQLYQRSLFQSIQANVRKSSLLAQKNKKKLKEDVLKDINRVLKKEKTIIQFLKFIIKEKITGARVRCHGDFHLGQLLFTGSEFIILDFEGEPCKSLNERRRKTSPLKDVAGIMRSIHYAAYSALYNHYFSDRFDVFEPWVKSWTAYHNAYFFSEYTKSMADSGILPENDAMIKKVLNVYLIDKAFYELAYEINNRPDFIKIPVKGLESVLNLF